MQDNKNDSSRRRPLPERGKYSVCFEPIGLKAEVQSGTNLLEAAHKAGVYLSSTCGGDGFCGKCKVIIERGRFKSKPTTLLTADEVSRNFVLACRCEVLSDMAVTVPKLHALEGSQILMDAEFGVRSSVLDPLVRRLTLEMLPPTVQDHTADLERLYIAIRKQVNAPVMETGLGVLQKLSKVLRESNYRVTVTVARRGGMMEVIDVAPARGSKGPACPESRTAGRHFAAAVDTGTTTIVAHLLDISDGSTVDTEAAYNSQLNFGDDYIRRIIYAEENNAFDLMQSRVVQDVNNLITTMSERQKIDLQDVTAVVCSGNTAMEHFLLGLDPTRIRREPYIASAGFVPPIRAAEIGIRIHKRGLLYCLPAVAAYVGGDIVAGVLATGIYKKVDISIFVDIGTNGEVVLGNRDWLVCASSSAGPAFEGSGVKCGMRAAAGAIERLRILGDGSIEFKTIGGIPPVGICGTGLLDTIAELFVNGVIDRTGRFNSAEYLAPLVRAEPAGARRFTWGSQIKEGDDGLQFQLVPPDKKHHEIVITQADIDNLVRSKAGVFAAIRVLMESTQTKLQDIDAVYLAGGFGNFLDVRQAVTIGMLPDVPADKIHFVGNTSVAGAKMALLSCGAFETAEKIAGSMTYFDLMSHPDYMDEFMRAKFLPHTDLSLFPSLRNVNGVV
ncbi:MAG: ASKHA domain-containing protein [Sedimentisphaerales bacterium]|nr:ASKHA domain-containing protein [Sedimentisphaerales bacterium]